MSEAMREWVRAWRLEEPDTNKYMANLNAIWPKLSAEEREQWWGQLMETTDK